MNLFKRITAVLGTGQRHDMANSYPPGALETGCNFRVYPPKAFLKDRGVFAYRLEFATLETDAIRVMHALASEFDWSEQAPYQEGRARHGDKSVHFSIRPEFGAAVVVIITNSTLLIEKIDALHLEPPPPWFVFPDVDASTLGALQGSIEYWWDWLFAPFWKALDDAGRARYLLRFPPDEDWSQFLSSRQR